jgi:two-component system response regulator FixJ
MSRHASTVVIVDDDEALLEALTFGLELEGFEVQSHRSAATVLAETLLKTNCCLVIDYKMPGLNGLDLLSRLRRQAVELPAIIITSHANSDILARCRALGAAVVEKPLLTDGLLIAIRNVLGLRVTPDRP